MVVMIIAVQRMETLIAFCLFVLVVARGMVATVLTKMVSNETKVQGYT
jgi:hypothetical protein